MSRTETMRPGLLIACAGRACALALASAISATAVAQERNPFDTTPAGVGGEVSVSEFLTVDLHVQDENLANVLQMLSIQSERNIVMSSDVSAMVTADLYNVTFHEALEAILNVNGYGYIERGNFIYVYTLEEIAQIERASRIPVSKVVQLNYLNANDAAEFCSPLLSEIGQIKTNGDVDVFSVPDDNPVGDEQFALSATMVLFDYPEHVEEIEKLIKQLDTKPSQVLVEATILQTALTEANAFGVDFSFLNDINFTDFINVGGPLGAANALINGGSGGEGEGISPADNNAFAGTSTVGNTSGPGGFKLGIIQDDFSLFVRLLDEVSDTTVLSNPKILAVNRAPARVLVGERVGYLNTTSTETSTTQTVEFLDTGTQLSFRPFISTNGDIRMELNPSVSEGVIREATDAAGSNVTIPDEITQELTTNVIVRDGSTIVLGGLFKETTIVGRRQVPFVGDLPIIGAAFRGHNDSTDRSEIIFMITPTIMNDDVLLAQGDAAMDELHRVRTGTRNGLLPWSRDRMTAKLNLDAERLINSGETDRALWKLRRSLNLNPNQPEAIEMREELLGTRKVWPSRSILDRVIQETMDLPDLSADADLGGFTPTPDKSVSKKADGQAKSSTTTEPSVTKDGASEANAGATLDAIFDFPAASRTSPHSDDVDDLELTVTMTPREGDAANASSKPTTFAELEAQILKEMGVESGQFTADVEKSNKPENLWQPNLWFFDPAIMADRGGSATSNGPIEIEQPAAGEELAAVDMGPMMNSSTPAEMTFLVGDGPIPPRYGGLTITSGWRTIQDILLGADRSITIPGDSSSTIVEVDTEND